MKATKGKNIMGIYDRDWYRGEQKSPYKADPAYGYGHESSAIKRRDQSKHRGLNMKLSSFIILTLVISYVIAVGYNVTTVHNTFCDEKFWAKNNTAVTIEVGTRLGLAQSLVIIGSAISNKDSVWENPRVMRETINTVYDWYAPIQWSPILSVSKEITWLRVKAGLDNSSPTSSSNGYAYVKSNALNVRSGPSANNRVLATLRMNSKVQVINKTGTWWKIRQENIEGYVNSAYLRK
jgi:hypothetical protein